MSTPQLELAVVHDGVEIVRYTLVPGEYLIGRAPECSLVVNVGLVSRQHARLVVGENSAVTIEDLGSGARELV